jgi:hypothetical protein
VAENESLFINFSVYLLNAASKLIHAERMGLICSRDGLAGVINAQSETLKRGNLITMQEEDKNC